MNFLERAAILTSRGVPVAPVAPNSKRCVLSGWPDVATTDQRQLDTWAQSSPNANTAAVCRLDGIAVLDVDCADFKLNLTEPTFIIKSAGKGFPHYYFKHTDESRAMGNRIIIRDGVTRVADFQANRKYVVGPGSQLEDGREYTIVSDAPIQPVPAELIEWLTDFSIGEAPPVAAKPQGDTELSETFDFLAMMRHFGLTGYWKGNWYIVDWCPVSGFPHNGSKHTGFYYDGRRLGFHCFAAGCEGNRMSFGQVLRHMNTQTTPFRGDIWKDDSDKWIGSWKNNATTTTTV